ncbi:Nicotinamide-nucleotide amidohydrolase PncC [compost metagenome]
MKASVLGIGTELVDGQIVNKNAPWISEKLKDFGMQTSLHLVVPDDWDLMIEAIDYCAARSDVIFITGGLGPTSDDFTRNVVAQWTQQPLEFDDTSWKHVSDRLTSRGYTVKEIQRQQCYFPKTSRVLHNPEGTANGFYIEANDKKLFILPGPPREIEAVWTLAVHEWLVENTKSIDPHITRKWDTLGVGESDIAVIAEEILEGVSVEKGYRVHLPYVEVKLSFLRSRENEMQPYVDRLTEAFRPHLYSRDGEDVAQIFAKKLSGIHSLSVVDEVTGQFLVNRLMPSLRKYMTHNMWSFTNDRDSEALSSLQLQLLPIEENSCQVVFDYEGRRFVDTITSPYKFANMHERRQQYFAELALIFWLKNLTQI